MASPGLFGSWVYDDLLMVDSPLYDGWDDVASVFQRTARDYFRAVSANATSETYRPATMAVLIATHVVSPTPLAHHLVGWLLHLCVAALLWRTLRRPGVTRGVALFVTALFLLHPVGVEAYVWINGRSDVTAALFVMASAGLIEHTLRRREPTEPNRNVGAPRAVVLALMASSFAFLALSSKETALGALVAVWVAGLWRARQRGHGSALAVPLVASGLGIAAYFLLWSAVRTGAFGTVGRGSRGFTDPELWRFVPKLFGVGAGALFSPHAAPMQSCSWLALRPLSALEWSSSLLGLLIVGLLVRRRDVSGLVLLGGAAATLAPCAVLYDALWLGLDRYLYMPLLLVLMAVSPHVTAGLRAVDSVRTWLPRGAAAALLVLCAATTYIASSYYVDHPTWMASGVLEDPEDPTRYLLMAQELMNDGHPEAARARLAQMPPQPWPPPVTLSVMETTRRLGDNEAYERLLARALASGWDHPGLDIHRINRALRSGNVEEALALVPRLASTDVCPELAGHLRAAAHRYSGAEREAIVAAFVALPCVAATPP